MNSSRCIIEYNKSCSLDISLFTLSQQIPPIIYVLVGIGNILGSITAFAGNAIILLALRHCSALHPSTKALFFSLATSDFGVGLVAQPLFASYTFAIVWNDATLYCTVGLPYSLVSSFLGFASFWTLTVVAFDRYLALILRYRYRLIVTVKRVMFILIVGWLFSALFTFSGSLSILFRRIASNTMLVSCLLLSSFFYLKTYVSLRRHQLHMDSRSSLSVSYYRESLNTMFIVYCLFLGTYLPILCASAAATALGLKSSSELIALDITSFLALLNSSINPVVYFWRISEIKRKARQVLRGARPCYLAILHRLQRNRVIPFNSNSQALQS